MPIVDYIDNHVLVNNIISIFQGTCSITNPTIEGKVSATTSMEIAASNMLCSTSSSVFTGVVHLSKDVNFRCSVRDTLVSNSNQFSDTFVVNAYSK